MARAASILMSLRWSSARRLLSSQTASSAYALAAMKAIFVATASCMPTLRPHCTRSLPHSRAILTAHFALPAHVAGSDRRPVFSVVRAIFSPSPSRPIRFLAGTLTWENSVTPFSMPRNPMNELRRLTVMPGVSASTTNALIFLPVLAMTTSRSATTPFVVHNFTPSIT